MQVAKVNQNGLNQIADALGQHHKLGREHFTESMLHAWASDVEDHFMNGNGCYFEIRCFDSASGWPIKVVLTPEGYDLVEIEEL